MALVHVHTARSQPDAAVTVSALEAAGIRAFAFGKHISRAQPHFDVAFGGIRIMVSESDATDAIALLDAREPDTLEPETAALRRDLPHGILGLVASFALTWMPWWTTARRFHDEESDAKDR